jgi:hypothetical protein
MSHPVRFFMITVAVAALVVAGIYALGAPGDSPENSTEVSSDKRAEADSKTPAVASMDEQSTPASKTETTAPHSVSMDNRTATLSTTEAKAVAEFEKKVNDYKALRDKLEGQLEKLDDTSKPEEIEKHRSDLRALISKERATAKRGDFFTPEMEALVRRLCKTAVAREGEDVESTINDENPGKLPSIGVNDRYPDGIPVTTMPAQLLETLPKLPEYIEYRFLGKRFVLLDAGAGMVLDVTPDVLT